MMDLNFSAADAKMEKRKFKKLCMRIRNQMEFYFSDSNLTKDRFLTELVSKDPDGFVDIEVFKSFNKIKELTKDCDTDICLLIASAVGRSDMFEISKDHKKLRRTSPVDLKDFDACTLYVEKLPLHADRKWVQDVFRHFGVIKYVNVPRYKVTNKIKGFAFIEFESADGVKNACEYYKLPSEKECSASEDEIKNIKNAKRSKIEETSEKKNKKSRTRSISESSDKADLSSLKNDQHPDTSEKNIDSDFSHHKNKRKRRRTDSGSDSTMKKLKESSDEGLNSLVIKSHENPKMEELVAKTDSNKVKSKEHKELISDVKTEEVKTEPKEQMEIVGNEEKSVEVSDNKMVGTEMEDSKSKKRRRKRHRSNVERPFLRVMPKTEWKMYRNKYLELQRSTMKFLKQQIMLETQELREQETHVKAMDISEQKKSAQFIPDVIIKVTLPNPVKNSSEVKDLIKTNAVVAYIDAPVNSTEVYIRCHNSDEALAIVKEEKLNQLGKSELLKEEEEKKYWEKIEMDKKLKYENPVRQKKRGRDKLLAKAAKLEEIKNKHIYFED